MSLKAAIIAATALTTPAPYDAGAPINTPSPNAISESFDPSATKTYQTANIGGWSADFETKYPQDTIIKTIDEMMAEALDHFYEIESDWHDDNEENIFQSKFYNTLYAGFYHTMKNYAGQLKINDARLLTDPSAINDRVCIYQNMTDYLNFYEDNLRKYDNENYEPKGANNEFYDDFKEQIKQIETETNKLTKELEIKPSCAPLLANSNKGITLAT